MNRAIVSSQKPVLLVGGGDCTFDVLSRFVRSCQTVVAADGGAEACLAVGRTPDLVIGDMDSLPPDVQANLPSGTVHRIDEQNSTDFDKCLRHIKAPLIVGCGFLGARLDHQLAAMTVLTRRPDRRCVLIGAQDVVVLCPPRLSLDVPVGTRVSLFPMGAVTGHSTGLRWPLDGIGFAPDGVVGTSNEAVGQVHLGMDGPGMLLILPVDQWPALQAALEATPDRWPSRA